MVPSQSECRSDGLSHRRPYRHDQIVNHYGRDLCWSGASTSAALWLKRCQSCQREQHAANVGSYRRLRPANLKSSGSVIARNANGERDRPSDSEPTTRRTKFVWKDQGRSSFGRGILVANCIFLSVPHAVLPSIGRLMHFLAFVAWLLELWMARSLSSHRIHGGSSQHMLGCECQIRRNDRRLNDQRKQGSDRTSETLTRRPLCANPLGPLHPRAAQ
jgi:hypothetical protein